MDDESAVREVLAAHLRCRSFEVETAADGGAALDLISADPARYDLVITDNQMPRLNGIELVTKLRAMGFRRPIVFFSSDLAPAQGARLLELGIESVVEKGHSVSELMAAIYRALGG